MNEEELTFWTRRFITVLLEKTASGEAGLDHFTLKELNLEGFPANSAEEALLLRSIKRECKRILRKNKLRTAELSFAKTNK